MRETRSGFTLIELMVVVIIIVALAGMVLPHFMDRPDDMKAGIAQGEISGIQTGLQMYKLDNGRYPTDDEGLNALIRKPTSAKNWKGPYLQKPPNDPWKQPFHYKAKGERNAVGPDVWSMGADGQNGTEDDVWPES